MEVSFIWARRDCLESLALNESTDFASKKFFLFAKTLRSLLASRSNPLNKTMFCWGLYPNLDKKRD